MQHHGMIHKNPGVCILCGAPIPAEKMADCAKKGVSADMCSVECVRAAGRTSARYIAKMVKRAFEDTPRRAEFLDMLQAQEPSEPENEPESYDRPMSKDTRTVPKVVKYRRDTSKSTWYKGETDADVVTDLLASV